MAEPKVDFKSGVQFYRKIIDWIWLSILFGRQKIGGQAFFSENAKGEN